MRYLLLGIALLLTLGGSMIAAYEPQQATTIAPLAIEALPHERFIVQGSDADSVALLVIEVGGSVERTHGVINAVSTRITPTQRAALAGTPGIERIYRDAEVTANAPISGNLNGEWVTPE